MRRDQLEHAIRTACQIIEQPAVVIVGSQAILATYDETGLPSAATVSIDVDVLPIADTTEEPRAWPISWRVSPANCRRSRHSTASASTASASIPRSFPKAGATGS